MEERHPNHTSLLEALAQCAQEVIFVFDPALVKFLYANPAFERLWQLSIESANDNPNLLFENIHPEDRNYVRKAYHNLVKEQQSEKKVEFRLLPSDGELKWVSLRLYIINSSGKHTITAGLASDVTGEKKYQENLHKFAAKKDSVLEILSHDLAGPFNNIHGIASRIAKKVERYDDPGLNKMIEMISSTSERSIRLIREFVKQEFLESSHEALIKYRVDLVREVKNVIDQYKSSEKDIVKTFNLEATSEKIYAAIDKYKFIQAINNLISNSIKFTHDHGIINIRIDEKDETVLLSIQDNGIGIPANRQEGLFEKFTKARRPGIKGEHSVGLGMSIIKTIVEWHGGKIWFKSVENEGSIFYIEIPKE